jgi:hypothetical protein
MAKRQAAVPATLPAHPVPVRDAPDWHPREVALDDPGQARQSLWGSRLGCRISRQRSVGGPDQPSGKRLPAHIIQRARAPTLPYHWIGMRDTTEQAT